MKKRFLALVLTVFALVSAAGAQTPQAEVTITLNEQFFDALLDAVFKNNGVIEFPISAGASRESRVESRESLIAKNDSQYSNSFAEDQRSKTEDQTSRNCGEVIRLQRERDGVRTSVRFRDGRISAPIAFTGNYNPPLIGCVEFGGVAETEIELEFDKQKQALVGRARVLNVNLTGAGGIGGGIVARLVQNSIDRKINPIQILSMDKVSFTVPVQNAGSIRMKAVGMRHEVTNGALNVRISYEFLKV
jgi:hypothetical protein